MFRCRNCGDEVPGYPSALLAGQGIGCECSGKKRYTTESFIEKAGRIHDYKYDYSLVRYKNTDTPVRIKCPDHGVFRQTPHRHFQGHGCRKCGDEKNRERLTWTTQEFIAAAKTRFPRKFKYEKTVYVKSDVEVTITCRKHDDFCRTPNAFLQSKYGCQKCGIAARAEQQRLNQREFLDRARAKHGDKYNYDLAVYTDNRDPITVCCPEHGPFEQTANSHLSGRGCPDCGKETTRRKRCLPIELFIEQATKVHAGKYDYSKVEYVNNRTPVEIICPVHTSFFQAPGPHKDRAQGCRKCRSDRLSKLFAKDTKWFIRRAKEVHGRKYDYSRVKYTNQKVRVWIGCKRHKKWFRQTGSDHLSGYGCQACGVESLRKSMALGRKEFIRRARRVHGNTYDYSLVNYVNTKTPVDIRCRKHGPFAQKPENHYQRGAGCWACSESKGERKIAKWLKAHGFEFEREKGFPTLRHKARLRYDFCLELEGVLIEFDGEQHFTPFILFGGAKKMKQVQTRDAIKTRWATKNKWRLIRIRFDEDVDSRLDEELGS